MDGARAQSHDLARRREPGQQLVVVLLGRDARRHQGLLRLAPAARGGADAAADDRADQSVRRHETASTADPLVLAVRALLALAPSSSECLCGDQNRTPPHTKWCIDPAGFQK